MSVGVSREVSSVAASFGLTTFDRVEINDAIAFSWVSFLTNNVKLILLQNGGNQSTCELNCDYKLVNKSTILIALKDHYLVPTRSATLGSPTVPMVDARVKAGTGATPRGEQPTSNLAKFLSIGAVDPRMSLWTSESTVHSKIRSTKADWLGPLTLYRSRFSELAVNNQRQSSIPLLGAIPTFLIDGLTKDL